jgi:hypothetical protein
MPSVSAKPFVASLSRFAECHGLLGIVTKANLGFRAVHQVAGAIDRPSGRDRVCRRGTSVNKRVLTACPQ